MAERRLRVLPLLSLWLLVACAPDSEAPPLTALPQTAVSDAPAVTALPADGFAAPAENPDVLPVPADPLPALDLSLPLPAPGAIEALDGSRPSLLPPITAPQRRTRVSVEPFLREVITEDQEKKWTLDGGQITVERPLGPGS